MKFWGMLKLVGHEYRYEMKEWILSLVLQCLAFVGVFFLFSVAGDIDRVCGEYMSPLYPDGYAFHLIGYSETNVYELEKIGFYNITFSNTNNQGYAVIDSLRGIWRHKLWAVLEGNDIWNQEVDEVLCIIFFCQITLGIIGIALFLIMLNNLANSVAMKLMRRQRYIKMLGQLGCSRIVCQGIYYIFIITRSTAAFLMAVCLSKVFIDLLNGYLQQNMFIRVGIAPLHWVQVTGIWILSMFLIWVCFQRQWRHSDGG